MTDEIRGAENLAAALGGGRPANPEIRAMSGLGDELNRALSRPVLNESDRARIYSHAMRLTGSAPPDVRIRRVLRRVPVSRRGVIGGVAAAGLAAAVGYAVVQQRRTRAGRPVAA